MSKSNLHPTVRQFKQFVKKHPKLVKQVRDGNKTWQDIYEEWTILGEEDEIWEKYTKLEDEDEEEMADSTEEDDDDQEKNANNKSSSLQAADILGLLKSVNLDDIQGHINNLSGVMKTLQGLMQSFQSNSSSNSNSDSSSNSQSSQQQPFNYRQF